MTFDETIKIMALLGAFYGAGKANPEVMAEGWHTILEPYEFKHAYNAVLNYAKSDVREYATFPSVGNIVRCIEEEMRKEQAPVKEVVRAISYGWGYDQLSKEAQGLIGEERYKTWLKMDAEEFSNKAHIMAETLKSERKRLQG